MLHVCEWHLHEMSRLAEFFLFQVDLLHFATLNLFYNLKYNNKGNKENKLIHSHHSFIYLSLSFLFNFYTGPEQNDISDFKTHNDLSC